MANHGSDDTSRPSEFALIAEFFAPLASNAPGALGLVDDTALFSPPPGHELVLKTDAIVEHVHFRHDDPPASVAKKALRVNLSDLAAKGATPVGYLMDLLLPDWPDRAWLAGFSGGLAEDQATFGVSLMGGDTSATPGPLAVAVTAFGLVPTGAMIRRAGARPGDLVFVSGTIGDAGGGLAVLEGHKASHATAENLIFRYRVPQPRVAFGMALRGVAHAALDVSDGLVADLGHLADVSQVRIEIDAPRIPLSSAFVDLLGEGVEARIRAATSGDDYEIAFTAGADERDAVFAAARRTGTSVHEIGRVSAGAGVALIDGAGHEIALERKGFVHF